MCYINIQIIGLKAKYKSGALNLILIVLKKPMRLKLIENAIPVSVKSSVNKSHL